MKNAGYTLVEAMVVVAILAVALTIGIMSINSIFALDVKETAKDLTAELSKGKVACMTRQGENYLRLYKTEDGIWVQRYESDAPAGEAVKIGKSRIMVTYYVDKGAIAYSLDDTDVYLSFTRGDGSFTTIDKAWELYNDAVTPPVSGNYYTSIVISSQHNERTVTLWPQTGRVDVTG